MIFPTRFSVLSLILIFVLFALSVVIENIDHVSKLRVSERNLAVDFSVQTIEARKDGDIRTILKRFEQEVNTSQPSMLNYGQFGYWHLITIQNLRAQNMNFVVLIDNPTIDIIDVYQLPKTNNTHYRITTQLGDTRINNELIDIAMPNIPIGVVGQETRTILLKTYTNGSPQVPISLFLANDFERYQNVLYLLWGGMIGIVFVMMAYNFILYLGVKDPLYILYVGYIVSFLFVMSFNHGFAVFIYPKQYFLVLSQNIIPVYFLLGNFLLLFTFFFFKFNENYNSFMSRLVLGFSGFMCIFCLVALTQAENNITLLFFVMQFFNFVICLIMIGIRIKQQHSLATFYVLSWLPLLGGTFVAALLALDLIDYSFWTRHAAFFGVAVQMAMISMALAERLRINKSAILYQATHDKNYDLANTAKLEETINHTPELRDTVYTIMLIEVDPNTFIDATDSPQDIKLFYFDFIASLQRFFTSHLRVIEIDQKSQFNKVCMVREGVFALTITSNDEALLSKTITEFLKLVDLNNGTDFKHLNTTLNIGVASNDKNELGVNAVLSNALQAIEIAKEKQLPYWLFNEPDKTRQIRRTELAIELQKGIAKNRLQLYHQPKLDAQSKKVVGSEVLVRWVHSKYGDISPTEFISVAKDTGLILLLTRCVIEIACQHLTELLSIENEQYTVSINISYLDLQQANFIEIIDKIVSSYNINPNNIIFELADLKMADGIKQTQHIVDNISKSGYGISVDGFSSQLANFGSYAQRTISEIKLDNDPVKTNAQAISNLGSLSQLIQFAQLADIKVVATGIDSNLALESMSGLPFDYYQGFMFCEPLPFDIYKNWLHTMDD